MLFSLILIVAVTVGVVGGFVLCFGDPDSPDCLGRTSRILSVTVPKGLVWTAKALHVWWLFRGIGRAVDWFVNDRHPVIQILYVVLVFGGYGAFWIKGYPLLPNPYFAGYHKTIGAVLFVLCVITFLLTSFTDPGIITTENVAGYKQLFPYDGFMYKQKPCAGCDGMDKVARSKHCRYLKKCVASYGKEFLSTVHTHTHTHTCTHIHTPQITIAFGWRIRSVIATTGGSLRT
jgi:hypothetical protein